MYKRIVLTVILSSTLVKTESSISELPVVYGLENGDARFTWKYVGTYSKIEWRKGDTSGTIKMFCSTGCDTPSKSPDYDIDYLEGVNSVGMILHNVNKSFESQYTVRIYTDGKPGPFTSSNLTVIKRAEYETFKQQLNLTINGQPIIPGKAVEIPKTGMIRLSLQVPETYEHNTTCIKNATGDTSTIVGSCSGTTCEFKVDVEDGDEISVSVLIVGFSPSEKIWYIIKFTAQTATTVPPETTFVRSATDVLTYDKTSDSVPTSAIRKNNGTHILTTSDGDTNLFSESITTTSVDGLVDTDSKLVIWQILLIITCGVFFFILTVVIIIYCLHKSDNNYSEGRRIQRHESRTRVKTDNLSRKRTRIPPQKYNDKSHKSHPDIHQNNENQYFPDYFQRYADNQLLVNEGPVSVINITRENNNMKYPFNNIITRYPGSYISRNFIIPYEPKPDYNF